MNIFKHIKFKNQSKDENKGDLMSDSLFNKYLLYNYLIKEKNIDNLSSDNIFDNLLENYNDREEYKEDYQFADYLLNNYLILDNKFEGISLKSLTDIENSKTNIFPFYKIDDVIKIDSENFNSSENIINQKREEYLHKDISPDFLNLLREEDFEFGYKTRSEEILREQLNINALATRNWLNELFLKFFHDETILIGILRLIGRFDEQIIFPQGHTMALAVLNHENDEVKELGIRAFEKWCSIESLNVLQKIKTETKWLQDYIDQVICDLKEELCHS
jgi:hypothetical protein